MEVQVRFDSTGAQEFGKLTGAHVGENLAILLDGKVVSAPSIRGAIYGECQITGQFTEAEARDLASALENPLATPVKVESERTVSATLGESSIWRGVTSGVIGVLITFVFVLVYYRFAGVLANLALLVNIILLFGPDEQPRLRANAARHRRHHPDHRSGDRRQRAHLRTLARGTRRRQDAAARHPGRV